MSNKEITDILESALDRSPNGVFTSTSLRRSERESLVAAGYLIEVLKGWYVLRQPGVAADDLTFWQGMFWPFCHEYLKSRFGDDYCLSAESSLDIHAGSTGLPTQLVIIAAHGGTSTVALPGGRSLLMYADKTNLPPANAVVRHPENGLRVMALAHALLRASPSFYEHTPATAAITLNTVRPEDVIRSILSEDRPAQRLTATSRLLGGLRSVGQNAAADRIQKDIGLAGRSIAEINPFAEPPRAFGSTLIRSPHVARLKAMWAQMRGPVEATFATALPFTPSDPASILSEIEGIYVHDAYNSLSIEGYIVTRELIERIRRGDAPPENEINAMSAKGYFLAHQAVAAGVREVLARQHEPAEWLSAHLADWYRALYTPPIQAGLIEAAMLAGYRERRVYIRGADHVPPSHEVVPELMETLFDLLRCERDAAVRGVLGHFCFVFIHPYQDGNGRIARFLMNYFLTTAGHPWTVIRKGSDQVGRLSDVRKAYMDALGHASGRGDIQPFAQFVRQEMELCRALLRPMQTETLLPALDGTERHNNFSSISLNSNRF